MRTSLLHATRTLLFIIAACIASTNVVAQENAPMYGQPSVTRSAKQKQADEAFIQQATDAAKGDRKAAALNALDAAEKVIAEGNAEEAIKQFNKAWLLNPDDFQAYWGFGRAQLMRNNVDDAVKHFDKAVELATDPDMKISLLNDAGIAYSLKASRVAAKDKAQRSKLFTRANDLFQQSVTLDPTFGNAWLRWSQSLQREENYAEAWAKLKKAEENGASIPKSYLKALSEKMPQPK